VSAAGQPVDQVSTLQRIIRGHKPGDVVDIDVMRFGQKKTFKIKLTEPAEPKQLAAATDSDSPIRPTTNAVPAKANDKLGITVEPVSADFARQFKLTGAARNGLRIASVSGRGPTYGTGLGPNWIILGELFPQRRDIKSVEDLQAAVNSLKAGDVIELKVCAPREDGSCQTNAVSVPIEK